MSLYIEGMEMPKDRSICVEIFSDGGVHRFGDPRLCGLATFVPPHGRLKKRIVYRGEVYNALEAARINSLDGILNDPYKEGFHDGLKKAIQILANEVEDAPTIIPAEEGE